jgi:hypothetical protein
MVARVFVGAVKSTQCAAVSTQSLAISEPEQVS